MEKVRKSQQHFQLFKEIDMHVQCTKLIETLNGIHNVCNLARHFSRGITRMCKYAYENTHEMTETNQKNKKKKHVYI